MKTKCFRKYLEKRLTKDEIAEIEREALIEVRCLMGKDPKDVFKNRK